MDLKNVLITSIVATSLLITSCGDDDSTTIQKPKVATIQNPEIATKATITGGPYTFTVDGKEDKIPEGDITVTKEGKENSKRGWIITDTKGKILGLPPKPSAVNFDDAGLGKCLVWYIGYEEGLEGLEPMKNASDLKGTFTLSNSIEVNRIAPNGAAALAGGPFEFIVDLEEDRLADDAITIDSSSAKGNNKSWIITDLEGKILGLPGKLSGPEFNDAGVGTCLIWYISYNDGLIGLKTGNNTANLNGATFYISNPIKVVRKAPEGAAILSGGPFEFNTVGDGTADNLEENAIIINKSNVKGATSKWVVTDNDGVILGLPPMPSAVNFDTAGEGTCLIWYISYDKEPIGLEAMTGKNAKNLEGTFYLSNPIKILRKATSI